MNLKKQAQILLEMICIGKINHSRFISWIDQIVESSDEAEDWMVKLSFSKSDDSETIQHILGWQFGHCFEGSFTELIAIVGALKESDMIPTEKCWPTLFVKKDFLDIPEKDFDSINARNRLWEIETELEESSCYDEKFRTFEPELCDFFVQCMAKHSDVSKFVKEFT